MEKWHWRISLWTWERFRSVGISASDGEQTEDGEALHKIN